jgi:hypothetical protein
VAALGELLGDQGVGGAVAEHDINKLANVVRKA